MTSWLLPLLVPVVMDVQFNPGREWIWDYFENETTLYSSEKYKVVDRKDDVIVIEMSTQVPPQAEFSKPHHRITVSLKKCRKAYALKTMSQPWSLKMEYFRDGRWEKTEPPSNLVFEEKFNCNGHVYKDMLRVTLFKDGELGPLFQQNRKGKDTASWYSLAEGSDQGILQEKAFAGATPALHYGMKLRR